MNRKKDVYVALNKKSGREKNSYIYEMIDDIDKEYNLNIIKYGFDFISGRIIFRFTPALLISMLRKVLFKRKITDSILIPLPEVDWDVLSLNCAPSTNIIIYVWDAWPQHQKKLEKIFSIMKPTKVLFSSAEAAKQIGNKNRQIMCEYSCERILRTRYFIGEKKDIDLLIYGRQDIKVVDYLKEISIKMGLVCLDLNELGGKCSDDELSIYLSRTKINLCFTSSYTNPNRSQGQEPVTLRYLQSIASGCVILGSCPKEFFIELSDYKIFITEFKFDVDILGYSLAHYNNNFSNLVELADKFASERIWANGLRGEL